MIVYDDSKENIKAGIAGNIAAVDMRGKVSYSYANELKSKADVDKAMKDKEAGSIWIILHLTIMRDIIIIVCRLHRGI